MKSEVYDYCLSICARSLSLSICYLVRVSLWRSLARLVVAIGLCRLAARRNLFGEIRGLRVGAPRSALSLCSSVHVSLCPGSLAHLVAKLYAAAQWTHRPAKC